MKKKSNPYEDKYGTDVIHRPKYKSPLIKWYQTDMTYEQKYKFGLLTMAEYVEWQKELAEEENAKTGSNTFWKDDEGERENLAANDYQDFLSANNINVSNNAAVDVDALLGQYGEDSPIEYLSEDQILANVNRDIHGGDTVLSEDEIAALFAAAEQGKPL